jgi:hypothetical protein
VRIAKHLAKNASNCPIALPVGRRICHMYDLLWCVPARRS